MKKNGNWKLNWLTMLALLGVVWFGPEIASAQDETTDNPDAIAVAMEAEAAASEVLTNAPDEEWDERWKRRAQFKDSIDPFREGRHLQPMVVIRHDAELRTNQTTEAMVVIGGSATVRGKVRGAVVVIGGDVKLEGAEVGDEVVAVLGRVKVGAGTRIHGDVVAVGGDVDVEEGAFVAGNIHPVDFEIMGLPKLDWLKHWIVECVLKLRPLAPQVGWVWLVAGAFFLFYLLIAVALPRPVQICVDEITRRPATTFFMALLTKLLLPVVIVVLAATVIGAVVIPFLLAALFFGALIGKVAFLQYLGQSLGRLLGVSSIKPVLGLVIGSVVLALLYIIPVLGLVVFAVSGLWGLGAAVTAGFGSLKRESAERAAERAANGGVAASAPAAMAMSATMAPPITSSMPAADPTMRGSGSEGFFAGTMAVPVGAEALISEALALPRASFWERMGAAFLDLVLSGILFGLVQGPPQGFLVVLAYFAGMWAWRGTTVGGVIVNLRVVRLDGQPLTLVVALVRGLSAAFSAFVFFLGFFWIAWDKDRQGWHDKIAGTVVVRVPRGRSLV